MSTFNETQHPRSTSGKFAAKEHQPSTTDLDGGDLADVVDRMQRYGSVDVDGYIEVLPPHERAKVGVRMQMMSRDYDGFLNDPEFMATCQTVEANDGSRLVTGQGTVNADRLLAMGDDIEDRINESLGDVNQDAWDGLPVVFRIGRRNVVRDGHHRLMRRLLMGEPVEYRMVTQADFDRWQIRNL